MKVSVENLDYGIGEKMTRAKTQSTPSISKITNSKHEIRNSKQKGKTQNTNFKTFKNAGEVLIARFWNLRIEILKLFRISIFGFRILIRGRLGAIHIVKVALSII